MTAGAATSGREGDLIVPVFDEHDLVADRSGKKIERRDQQLTGRDKQGRS